MIYAITQPSGGKTATDHRAARSTKGQSIATHSRSIVTGLLFTGGRVVPTLLWKGGGHYLNKGGACETSDLILFRMTNANQIEVIRRTGVVRHKGKEAECPAKAYQERVIKTIKLRRAR